MPTIDLTDAEFDALRAAVRRAIDEERYPHAPRLAPLKSAFVKLVPESAPKPIVERSPIPTGPAKGRAKSKSHAPINLRAMRAVFGDALSRITRQPS